MNINNKKMGNVSFVCSMSFVIYEKAISFIFLFIMQCFFIDIIIDIDTYKKCCGAIQSKYKLYHQLMFRFLL